MGAYTEMESTWDNTILTERCLSYVDITSHTRTYRPVQVPRVNVPAGRVALAIRELIGRECLVGKIVRQHDLDRALGPSVKLNEWSKVRNE